MQEIALRYVASNNQAATTDELVLADAHATWVVNLRSLRATQLFGTAPASDIRGCLAGDPGWSLPLGGGLPGTEDGVDGLLALDNVLTYRTRNTRHLLRALMPTSPSTTALLEVFEYVGDEQFGMGLCCPEDRDTLWRTSDCGTCPGVTFLGVPRAVTATFVGVVFTVMMDEAQSLVHLVNESADCDGQVPIISLGNCDQVGVDGGPGVDAGTPVARPVWPHAAPAPAECQASATTGTLYMTDPRTHQVVRADLDIIAMYQNQCTSNARAVAGVDGEPGNSPGGELARQAHIDTPSGVGQDLNCNLYFGDMGNALIRQVTPDGILRNAAFLPGLRAVAVHPALGVVAATEDALFLVSVERRDP